MAGGVRLVTVVGSLRRLDLVVPAAAPVVELLPDVVALAGEPVPRESLPRWVLGRLGAADLPAGCSLESAGVQDGDVLYLRRLDEPVVGLAGSDLVERVSAGSGAGFPPAADRVLLCSVAAALLTAVAVLLLVEASLPGVVTTVLLAGAAAGGGRLLQRAGLDGLPGGSAVLALAAVPLLAVATVTGLAVLSSSSPDPQIRYAVGLGGAALGGVLAAWSVRAARAPGGALALGAGAAALTLLLSLALTPSKAAALVAFAAVLLVPAVPRLVLRAAGLRLSDVQRADTASTQQLLSARRALPWVLWAVGALVVGCSVVLATVPQGAQMPLGALCGLLLVLRARQRRGVPEVLPLAVSGFAVLAVLAVGLVLSHPRTAGPLLVLGLSALALVVAAVVPSAAVDRPRWAGRRRRFEALSLIALVPLLGAVLGLFGVVVELARGAE